MNEVGSGVLDVLPALALVTAGDPRPLALVDLGTGAGLGCTSTGTATPTACPTATASSPATPARRCR